MNSPFSAELKQRLEKEWSGFDQRYRGQVHPRQPIQTVYGGAQLFKQDTAQKLGKLALKLLDTYAPNFVVLAKAAHLTGADTLPNKWTEAEALQAAIEKDPEAARQLNPEAFLAWTIYQRVIQKLNSEPVEDFRIDFEDGYGNRPDEEEDHDARRNARELAEGQKNKCLPPFIGIRIKPWTRQFYDRSVRTLEIFIEELVQATSRQIPHNFIVTLPKVTSPQEVAGLAEILERMESKYTLQPGALPLEIMIETTQSIFDAEGRMMLPRLLKEGGDRCRGAHFGTYDYTASCGLIARYQSMDHPACDYARHAMQVAYGSTGLMLSDGATNIMPVPVHSGETLNLVQQQENLEAVHAGWQLHSEHVRRSLQHGLYQGWDLHPAQLITRYATVYDFFLKEYAQSSQRLQNFIAKAAQATLSGDVFDDAATGRGLLNYFRLAYNSGAITIDEIQTAGLNLADLQGGDSSASSPWLALIGQA